MFGVVDWFDRWLGNAVTVFVIGLVLIYIIFLKFDLASSRVLGFMVAFAPIWLPVTTLYLFHEYWMDFVRAHFNWTQGRTTIEIKLPQDVFKSPEAMELVLIQLYQTASPDNLVQSYWDGKHPPTYGFEIVSRGGDVRFYINMPKKKFKNMAESHLYAQYPGIEIRELQVDYTAEIGWDPEKYFYFAFHYGLKRPDAYPIKTYFDFGLNTMPKEEEKVDPITVMIETLGSVGPGEHMWIQILGTAHKKHDFKSGSFQDIPDWKQDVQAEIETIMEGAKKRSITGDEVTGLSQLTNGEKDTITALERSLSKYAFDVKLRGMYIAEKTAMQPGERLGMLAGIWRQYDDVARNSIGPVWRTDTDWPWWQDVGGKVTDAWKKSELRAYKKRSLFKRPFEGKYASIFTTEELATVFHLPGRVALTPTLGRIPSTRSEAPGNLPMGSLPSYDAMITGKPAGTESDETPTNLPT